MSGGIVDDAQGIGEKKINAFIMIIGIVTLFTFLTFLFSAKEYSGIDADTDVGLKRIENRVYYVLTTLSSVGYGDIYPVSSRARLTGSLMMMLMLFSIV
tara:strand:- start:605 stop:901 length:297 start_codon:yes stop_codon:yes gene_type:complete